MLTLTSFLKKYWMALVAMVIVTAVASYTMTQTTIFRGNLTAVVGGKNIPYQIVLIDEKDPELYTEVVANDELAQAQAVAGEKSIGLLFPLNAALSGSNVSLEIREIVATENTNNSTYRVPIFQQAFSWNAVSDQLIRISEPLTPGSFKYDIEAALSVDGGALVALTQPNSTAPIFFVVDVSMPRLSYTVKNIAQTGLLTAGTSNASMVTVEATAGNGTNRIAEIYFESIGTAPLGESNDFRLVNNSGATVPGVFTVYGDEKTVSFMPTNPITVNKGEKVVFVLQKDITADDAGETVGFDVKADGITAVGLSAESASEVTRDPNSDTVTAKSIEEDVVTLNAANNLNVTSYGSLAVTAHPAENVGINVEIIQGGVTVAGFNEVTPASTVSTFPANPSTIQFTVDSSKVPAGTTFTLPEVKFNEVDITTAPDITSATFTGGGVSQNFGGVFTPAVGDNKKLVVNINVAGVVAPFVREWNLDVVAPADDDDDDTDDDGGNGLVDGPSCGDGVLQPGEGCDNGHGLANPPLKPAFLQAFGPFIANPAWAVVCNDDCTVTMITRLDATEEVLFGDKGGYRPCLDAWREYSAGGTDTYEFHIDPENKNYTVTSNLGPVIMKNVTDSSGLNRILYEVDVPPGQHHGGGDKVPFDPNNIVIHLGGTSLTYTPNAELFEASRYDRSDATWDGLDAKDLSIVAKDIKKLLGTVQAVAIFVTAMSN